MISKSTVKKYCCEDISLIENYDKAINDPLQTWDCHHRRETVYTADELIEIGEYYNRPACELIFLTKTQHNRLHKLGTHHSEIAKSKISKAVSGENNGMYGRKGKFAPAYGRIGEKHPMFGTHHSEIAKSKISKAVSGENNGMYGKTHSTETKNKISLANKGRLITVDTKNKMRESHLGDKNHNARKVVQYTLDNVFIKEWPCISSAEHELNISNISACCRNKIRYAGGFIWKYKTDNK